MFQYDFLLEFYPKSAKTVFDGKLVQFKDIVERLDVDLEHRLGYNPIFIIRDLRFAPPIIRDFDCDLSVFIPGKNYEGGCEIRVKQLSSGSGCILQLLAKEDIWDPSVQEILEYLFEKLIQFEKDNNSKRKSNIDLNKKNQIMKYDIDKKSPLEIYRGLSPALKKVADFLIVNSSAKNKDMTKKFVISMDGLRTRLNRIYDEFLLGIIIKGGQKRNALIKILIDDVKYNLTQDEMNEILSE